MGTPTAEQIKTELAKGNMIILYTERGMFLVWPTGYTEIPWSDILESFKRVTSEQSISL